MKINEMLSKPTKWRTLIILALVTALLVACFGTVLGSWLKQRSEQKTFDYSKTDLADFGAWLAEADVKGLTVDGDKIYYVKEYTKEDLIKEVNQYFLSSSARKATDKGTVITGNNKTEPIDYADDVYFYILSVSENGNKLDVDYFKNAYSTTGNLTIGAELFGADFDDALTGERPIDYGFEAVSFGTVEAGDIIVLSYTATVEGETTAYESFTGERVDLGDTTDGRVAYILEKGKNIGEAFTFTYVHDIDGDGEEETVEYEATVAAKITNEISHPLQATIPEDYFGTGADEELLALNGKTLTFDVVIEYSVAYDAYTWENLYNGTLDEDPVKDEFDEIKAIFSSVFGYSNTTATDKKSLMDAFATRQIAEYNADRELTLAQYGSVYILKYLVEKTEMNDLPEKAIKQAKELLLDQLYEQFAENGASYDSIEVFAKEAFGYVNSEQENEGKTADEKLPVYADFRAYIEQKGAPDYVKEQIILYHIYDICINLDGKQLKQGLAALVQQIIEENTNSSTNTRPTEQDVYDNYGKQALQDRVVYEAVSLYLYQNNTINWVDNYEK